MKKKSYLLIILFLFQLSLSSFGAEIRRTHRFIRSTAMGGAFTAVADNLETIAYNPAGIALEETEWSLRIPHLWIAYNEFIKDVMNNSSDLYDPDNKDSLKDLPGTRAYVETQLGIPLLFMPDSGMMFGLSSNVWVEFVFPKQTVLPMVHLEAIKQDLVEFAMATEISDWGLYVGGNLKVMQRTGVIADISLLRIVNLEEDEIQDEYNTDPPPIRYAADLGILYRIDHHWNPRIGISALDIGGIDHGSAGEVKQLNSIGVAATQDIRDLHLTYSLDFHDFTYSYFPYNTFTKRVAIGFEAAFGKYEDNTHLFALQLGLREFQYPSFGIKGNIGILEIGSLQWVENYGTEKNPQKDTRYMFLLAFNF